jgi:hypothetical protein
MQACPFGCDDLLALAAKGDKRKSIKAQRTLSAWANGISATESFAIASLTLTTAKAGGNAEDGVIDAIARVGSDTGYA